MKLKCPNLFPEDVCWDIKLERLLLRGPKKKWLFFNSRTPPPGEKKKRLIMSIFHLLPGLMRFIFPYAIFKLVQLDAGES